MSLGEGVLKVERPIAWKGSIALEVTMATKQMPNTLKTPPTTVLGRQRDCKWVPWDLQDPNTLHSLTLNEGIKQRSK